MFAATAMLFAVTSRCGISRPASTFNGQSVSAARTSTASNPKLANRIIALFIQAPFAKGGESGPFLYKDWTGRNVDRHLTIYRTIQVP
jgi:hypothetical protein